MARLLLHIGSPKTGSSAIQQALGLCVSALADEQVDLPEADFVLRDSALDSGNGEWLANFCTGIWPETSAKGWRVMQRLETIAANRRDVVLSSENFYYATASALQRVLQTVQPAFDEVGVVLYVRNPVDMCFSLWLQGVKRSFAAPVDIATYADSFVYDVLEVIQRFQAGLPQARLFVRSYDQHKSDLVPDFLTCLGDFFGLDAERRGCLLSAAQPNGQQGIVNRSLYAAEVRYMQLMTAHLHSRQVPEENILEAKRIASDLLLAHNRAGDVPTCPADVASVIALRAQPVINALNQQYGLALSPNSSAPGGQVRTVEEDGFIQATVAIAAGALCRIPPSLPVVFVREGDAFEFEGYVDHASPIYVSGWVVCKTFPTSSVLVLVEVGGAEITLVANIHRPDVSAHNPAYSAYCGFYYEFEGPAGQLAAAGHAINVAVLGSSEPLAKADIGT